MKIFDVIVRLTLVQIVVVFCVVLAIMMMCCSAKHIFLVPLVTVFLYCLFSIFYFFIDIIIDMQFVLVKYKPKIRTGVRIIQAQQ